jgi:hypothetical protein
MKTTRYLRLKSLWSFVVVQATFLIRCLYLGLSQRSVFYMIKCPSPAFDSGHQLVKEIFKAYTKTDSQRVVLDARCDLAQAVDLVMNLSTHALYMAWRFDHGIVLEIVSKNANEDKYQHHVDVIISCENDYMSDFECKAWLTMVSAKAVTSAQEKLKFDVNSTMVIHTEVHSVYPNSVLSFSESNVNQDQLASNRTLIFTWVEQYFPMCLLAQSRQLH